MTAPVREFDLPSGRMTVRRDHLVAEVTRQPRRRWWGRIAIAVALVTVAGVAANVALGLGIGGRIHDFVAGTPAPPPIAEHLRDHSTAERIMPLIAREPVEVSGRPHGVLAIETTAGPVALWTVETSMQGGTPPICYFVEFVSLGERAGEPRGDSNCIPRPTREVALVWARTTQDVDGRTVALVSGVVASNVASAWLRAVDGSMSEMALEGRFFLAELRRPGDYYELVARDASGAEVANSRVTEMAAAMQDFRDLRPTGPARTIIETRDSLGRPLRLTWQPAEQGVACVWVGRGDGGGGGTCGRAVQLRADEGIRAGYGASAQVLTLEGSVGPEIASLALRYEDGHVERIPIVERFVLVGIPRERFEEGKRPVALIGRDHAGRVVAERQLSREIFRPDSPIWLDKSISP